MQVPYNPVPTVSPEGRPTPNFRVDAPAAAFGSTVAQATEHLGKTIEGVGDEIFKRAIALQTIKNEAEATDADTAYMEAAGLRHAKFSAMQGKEAVDAYPDYIKGLKEDRTNIAGGLSNDMVRKLYDKQSLSTMGRTIFNGAGHAATEQRKWSIGSVTAQINLDAKTVEDNPQDEGLFKEKVERVASGARQLSDLQGNGTDSPQEKALVMASTSKLRAQQIIGLARVAPFEAATKLDEFKTQLTQEDFLKVDNVVRNQGRAVGSVNIAREVYGDGSSGKTLKEMESAARDKAQTLAPNDPVLAEQSVKAVQGIFNQDKYAKRQEEIENEQTVFGAIGKGVKDIQALRADPNVARAIDALPPAKQNAIPGQINSYNAAVNKTANLEHMKTLMGLAENDKEAFLNINPYSQNLNQAQMNQVRSMQEKLKKQAEADPRVQRALGWMRGAMGAQMEALGVFKRTDSNKDDYDHLTGTVQSALDVWMENHQKPPTYKEFVDQIAPQVLRERAEPGMIWGTNKKPFFTQTVPEKWSTDRKAFYVQNGLPEPNEQQIYKDFVKAQLVEHYNKKPKPNE